MKSHPAIFLLAAGCLGGLCGRASAAQPEPRAAYVFPAGGQAGKTFRVLVGGQRLRGAEQALFSNPAIRARVVGYTPLLPQREINTLRDKLRALQRKRSAAAARTRRKIRFPRNATNVWTQADAEALAQLRAKLLDQARRRDNPALGETVELEVAIAPGARPGPCDLRLRTAGGLTAPLRFVVDTLREYVEEERPIVWWRRASRIGGLIRKTDLLPPPKPMRVALPAVINGRIAPGESDRFLFYARKGDRLVFRVQARNLIPYLADAVPGWFQPVLALYDAEGRRLAYADDFRFDPDPALLWEAPRSGNFTLEIRDSIYRGREDFVYRIRAGAMPFATAVFPLGGPAGETTKIALQGWNLPARSIAVAPKEKGILRLSIPGTEGSLDRILFQAGEAPEALEREPEDWTSPQKVQTPITVNGRIDSPEDQDAFAFAGRAGEEIVAEVWARRLGSPLDAELRLLDPAGRRVAVSDDREDPAFGLLTHHADPCLRLRLPADGTYRLCLRDAQARGGPAYAYRLRISQPQPDFEARLAPSSLFLRPGQSVVLTASVIRRDGFEGPVALRLAEAPSGFFLDGGRVPAGTNRVQLTLTAPVRPESRSAILRFEASARVGGRTLTRLVVPADERMQAFIYRHLVPAEACFAAFNGRSRAARPMRPAGVSPIAVSPSGEALARFTGPLAWAKGTVRLDPLAPEEGIRVAQISRRAGTLAVRLKFDPAKFPPGTEGNLILSASLQRAVRVKDAKSGKGNKASTVRRVPLGVLPAIPFRVKGSSRR